MRIWTLIEASLLGIPFFYLWNYFAPIYAPNLPTLYLNIPFWHCIGVFALIGIMKALLTPSSTFWCHKRW